MHQTSLALAISFLLSLAPGCGPGEPQLDGTPANAPVGHELQVMSAAPTASADSTQSRQSSPPPGNSSASDQPATHKPAVPPVLEPPAPSENAETPGGGGCCPRTHADTAPCINCLRVCDCH